VRGIRPEALRQLPAYQGRRGSEQGEGNEPKTGISTLVKADQREDLTRVRRIQNLMDYRLEEIEGKHSIPFGAIKIAELLGVDEMLLQEIKAAWQEE
jgi:hypothetical protein